MPAALQRPRKRVAFAVAACAMLACGALGAPASAQPQEGPVAIRDAEIETTLRSYVDPIFVAAGLDPSQIHVVLLQDPSINAFVTDTRTMYIHTGLIAAVETPNELKGVMAHETGHIARSHVLRSRAAASRAMRPALISVGLGLMAVAAGAPDAGIALIAGSQQFAMADYVQFSQAQESQADQAAITFMDAAHQSPAGLLTFSDRTFRYNEMRSASRIPPWMRTHPLWSDRIQALRQRVAESPYGAVTDSPAEIEALKLIQAKLYGYTQTAGRTALKYPDSDTSAAARYARAVAAMRVSDYARADQNAESLGREFPNNPYYQELLGEVLLTSERAADSIPHQRRALALAPGNALLQINLARSLVALNTPAARTEAIGLLKAASRTEADNATAWYEMAQAYDAQGEEGLARLASAELRFSLGDWPGARSFAERAKERLTQGTIDYLRASDIAVIAETNIRSGGQRS